MLMQRLTTCEVVIYNNYSPHMGAQSTGLDPQNSLAQISEQEQVQEMSGPNSQAARSPSTDRSCQYPLLRFCLSRQPSI